MRRHNPKWRSVYTKRGKINPRFADKVILPSKTTGMQILSGIIKNYSCHMLYHIRNDRDNDCRFERSWKEYRKTQWKI
jgi:hypothetical protein